MVSPAAWRDLNFIAAPFCVSCGFPFDFAPLEVGGNNALCAGCLKDPPPFTAARAVLRYDDASRGMILAFKHGDQTHIAPLLAGWMANVGEDFLTKANFIVPVPLHRLRLLKRRYNQAALLAQILAAKAHKHYAPDILQRVRATPPQGHLSAKQRAENVEAAIKVTPKKAKDILGKDVLLIDDVYTTGATIKECAKVLKRAGAGAVYALTIARVR
jgi:ComF family protein